MSETVDQNKPIQVTEDGGIVKVVLQEGDKTSEKPTPGSKVTVHYTGKLNDQNGSKFDSSVDRNDPFVFDLGKGSVIKGWDLGVQTMHVGEKSAFTLKPEYGYGERGAGASIPPNSTLYFEIELLSWTNEEDISETSDGSLMKKVLKKDNSEEDNEPDTNGSKITLNYKCFLVNENDKSDLKLLEEKKDFHCEIGDDESFPHDGFAKCVKKMVPGELSRFTMKSNQAYGTQGNKDLNVGPNDTLVYEIELTNVDRAKDRWEMNTQEKYDSACTYKQRGNDRFKQKKLKSALSQYLIAQDFFATGNDTENEELKNKIDELNATLHNNVSMCYLSLKDYTKCINEATKVLEIDPNNVKALFRRSDAYYELKEYKNAKDDLTKGLEVDSGNVTLKKRLKRVNDTLKSIEQKEKKMFAKMFSKPLN